MMQRIIRLVDHLRLFGVGLVSDPTDIVFCLALAAARRRHGIRILYDVLESDISCVICPPRAA